MADKHAKGKDYEGFETHLIIEVYRLGRLLIGLFLCLWQERRPVATTEQKGKVRLELRKPYDTGQTEVLFELLAFLRRLGMLIPPPRQNQIRFYGVFAPHSKHKALLAQLVPRPPQVKASEPADHKNPCKTQPPTP